MLIQPFSLLMGCILIRVCYIVALWELPRHSCTSIRLTAGYRISRRTRRVSVACGAYHHVVSEPPSSAPMRYLMCLRVVYVCSAMIRTRPPFRPPTLSICHVSKSTRDVIDHCPGQMLNRMATGFCTPANRKLLNPAIMKAIASIRTYLQFRGLSCTAAMRSTSQEFEFFYIKQCAVEYDLLSMPFDDGLSPLTPLQNAVRLVLFIFGFATYTRFEPSAAYTQAIVAQLKESLEAVDLETLWTSDLLLWTFFFGAHISRQTRERPWFIACLVRSTRQLEIRSADEMQGMLLRFFYIGGFSRESLLEIWHEVSSAGQAHAEWVPNGPDTESAFLMETQYF
jgi:hypothetical protein